MPSRQSTASSTPRASVTECQYCARPYECQVRLVHHILADHPGILPLTFDDDKTVEQRLDELTTNERAAGNASTNERASGKASTNKRSLPNGHALVNGDVDSATSCMFCDEAIHVALDEHLEVDHGIRRNRQHLLDMATSASTTSKRAASEEVPIGAPPTKVCRMNENEDADVVEHDDDDGDDALVCNGEMPEVDDDAAVVCNGDDEHAADDCTRDVKPSAVQITLAAETSAPMHGSTRTLRSRSRNSFTTHAPKLVAEYKASTSTMHTRASRTTSVETLACTECAARFDHQSRLDEHFNEEHRVDSTPVDEVDDEHLAHVDDQLQEHNVVNLPDDDDERVDGEDEKDEAEEAAEETHAASSPQTERSKHQVVQEEEIINENRVSDGDETKVGEEDGHDEQEEATDEDTKPEEATSELGTSSAHVVEGSANEPVFDDRYYEVRPARCTLCSRAYTTNRALGYHMKSKHNTPPSPVVVRKVELPPVFSSPSLRPRRQAAAVNFNQPCEPTFNEAYYSTRVFRCTLCPRAYTLIHNLRTHCKQVHDGDGMTDSVPVPTRTTTAAPTVSPMPSKSTKAKPRNGNNQPMPEFTEEYYALRINLCPICPKGFERRDNLRRHVLNVHKVPFDVPPPSAATKTVVVHATTPHYLEHGSGSVADTPSPSVSNPQQLHSVESQHSAHEPMASSSTTTPMAAPTTAAEKSTSVAPLPTNVTEQDVDELRDLFQPSPRRFPTSFSSAAY